MRIGTAPGKVGIRPGHSRFDSCDCLFLEIRIERKLIDPDVVEQRKRAEFQLDVLFELGQFTCLEVDEVTTVANHRLIEGGVAGMDDPEQVHPRRHGLLGRVINSRPENDPDETVTACLRDRRADQQVRSVLSPVELGKQRVAEHSEGRTAQIHDIANEIAIEYPDDGNQSFLGLFP